MKRTPPPRPSEREHRMPERPRALQLDAATRSSVWAAVAEACEQYAAGVDAGPIAPPGDPATVRALLAGVDFARPMEPGEAIEFARTGLWRHSLHVAHRRHFGLFNPTPTTMGIAADALVAAFNPQLAAWGHSPFGVEVERHLIRTFAALLGLPDDADGTFTTGGQEANHTAVLCALSSVFPGWDLDGVRALPGAPVLYASAEAHHSLEKAARASGLGLAAVRRIPVDETLRLDARALRAAIDDDRAAGRAPFLVVATAGTTSAGIVDHVPAIADVARDAGLWLHVDAAWGGAAALVPELRGVLDGVERADSVTLDCHKGLSVPMSAGLFLTRHADALDRAFHVSPVYIPRDAAAHAVVDPYARSLQWSRRFIGLKVFLSLAVAGWDGYAAALRHQAAMADLLRTELAACGWRVVNRTPLPVVCFVDAYATGSDFVERVARMVVESGEAWLSTTKLGGTRSVLRACVTSFNTDEEDVRALVRVVNRGRRTAE